MHEIAYPGRCAIVRLQHRTVEDEIAERHAVACEMMQLARYSRLKPRMSGSWQESEPMVLQMPTF